MRDDRVESQIYRGRRQRAIRGVIDGGGTLASIDIGQTGAFQLHSKKTNTVRSTRKTIRSYRGGFCENCTIRPALAALHKT
jgi:hypothetical protein